MFFEYHPRISITQWNAKQTFPPSVSGSIDDYPDELAKKITLIKYFRTNFRDRAENRMLSKEEVEDTARGGPKVNMPFALKWLKKAYPGQIIIFTCHQREAQMMTADQIAYHLVTM